jgi:hypothetical protein
VRKKRNTGWPITKTNTGRRVAADQQSISRPIMRQGGRALGQLASRLS